MALWLSMALFELCLISGTGRQTSAQGASDLSGIDPSQTGSVSIFPSLDIFFWIRVAISGDTHRVHKASGFRV